MQARLLSERSDETWNAGASDDADTAALNAVESAQWVKDRLAETRSPRRLDTLCLDVDGAVCSWVKGRDADTELIRSAVEGMDSAAGSADEDALDPHQTPGVADRLPRLPLEVSYDLLDRERSADRTAVLAAPDAPARLFLDRIDALGVRVERVITFWHALAEAWDPGAKPATNQGPDIITTDHPPAAIVAVDHQAARLVWAWSQNGSLLACGSIRLKHARPASSGSPAGPQPTTPVVAAEIAPPLAEVHEHDIARLAADWLGWSAQIGVCPARTIVVGRPAGTGMSPREIGTALTRAWPGSLTDLAGCDDAVAETLRRTLDAKHINTFAPLTERPTRAHRSAYRSAAAALLVASACVVVLGVLFFARAARTRELAQDVRAERTQVLSAVDPALVTDPFAVRTIEAQINAIERRTGAVRVESPRPILQELETLSLVLAAPGISVDELDLTDSIITIKARLADVKAAEQLDQALRRVGGGSQLKWSGPSVTPGRSAEVNATYSAFWPQERTSP